MAFRPLHDRVTIRRVEEQTRSNGGIIIPDSATEKPAEGVVVSTGPKVEKSTLKAGDQVLFAKFAGTDVTIGSEELVVMRESDVMAVIEKKAAAGKSPAKKTATKKKAAKKTAAKKATAKKRAAKKK